MRKNEAGASRVRLGCILSAVVACGCVEVTDDNGSAADEAVTVAVDGTETAESETTETETGTSTETDTSTDTTTSTDTDTDTDTGSEECIVAECAGKVYQCGDCIDNDSDGKVDAEEPECWGPCDNNESGFKGNIPGQTHAPCTSMDCYFDADSGSGNDGCNWSHSCDPSDPNPSNCNYNQNANIPGSGMTCEEAQQEQDPTCGDVCGPLTPNGCDCFGCCEIMAGNASYTVYLGTGEGEGTCTMADVADPTKCAPCVQVEACLNPCVAEDCELCIGQVELPDDCEPECGGELQPCDPLANNTDCPVGLACISGCCHQPVG